MKSLAALLAASIAATMTAPALAAAPIMLTSFRALVGIDDLQWSPDGSAIAALESVRDFQNDRYDHRLAILSPSGGAQRVIVTMRGLDAPRFSPNGETVAFLADDAHHNGQIFVVPVAGGTPKQLTHAMQGVQQFAWRPDGRALAYVTPDAPRRPNASKTHHDLFAIHDDDYLTSAPPQPSHLWLISSDGAGAHRVTSGSWSVLETAPPFAGSVSDPVWSANGSTIAFTRQADADDGDSDRTTIVTVEAGNGVVHALTHRRSYEYDPQFAPSGEALAYLYPHGPGPISNFDVFVTTPGGGAGRDVTAGIDRDVAASYAWLPGGRGLVVEANDGGRIRLYDQPLHGRATVIHLQGRNAGVFAVSRSGAIAVEAENESSAPEVYVLASPHAAPHRITSLNASFDAFAYPRSVEVRWTASDGERDDGILTYPNGYVAGRKYPLVVYSHGGPEAASSLWFDGGEIGPLRDLFAARGYLVIEPNYRGSDNLGNAHEHGIYRDPGVGPDRDVMAGIAMLERRGIVDTSRIAAVGHSYGGYMTSWLIGHHHIWKCAVVADGAIDWTEEYELSGAGNLAWTRDSLGGTPWDPRSAQLYVTGSPITYAGKITTPTLILSGTDDVTVPITESFALYHALASRGVPVQFIGIPGAHHTPQDPVHLELYYGRIVNWVTTYLGR